MLTKMKLALVMCAALGGIAAAQGAGSSSSDAKPDRTEMKAKWAAKRAEMLAKYDTNKDGKLDAAERKVMIDDRATEQFQKMDSNGDGQISLAEFKAFKEAHPFHARHGFGRHRGMGKTK